MDVRTTDSIGSWEPMTRDWGTTAYEETKIQFGELVLGSAEPRAQAFALWALAHEPFLKGDELMTVGGGCGSDRPTPDHIEKAVQALGFSENAPTETASQGASEPRSQPKKAKKSGARKGSKQLSSIEKAILANFKEASKLIDAYRKAQVGLSKAEKDLEKAATALRDIDRDQAKLLAQFDATAEAVLCELGLLDGG